jgi:hypothetical protein
MEHASVLESIREVNASLVREMHRFREMVTREMDMLREEMRTFRETMTREMAALSARMDRLDRRFAWLVGLQITTLAVVVAALAAIVAAIVAAFVPR